MLPIISSLKFLYINLASFLENRCEYEIAGLFFAGALVNNVIEVSSDSDWSSDTESMSPNDMQDDYDHDDW